MARLKAAEEVSYDWGTVLLLSFDIAEGEKKDFFAVDYRSQDTEDKKWRGTFRLTEPKDDGSEKDQWAKRAINNMVAVLEESNPGYHWDWAPIENTDPYYYTVYCLGEWGVLGSTVFNARNVSERLAALSPPVRKGEFVFETYYDEEANQIRIQDGSIQFLDCDSGFISVYEEPKAGTPYVIGGDTAGEGSDFFVGQGIDNLTGRQVCTLRGQMDEDVYAKQMYCLGKWYNTALLSVEANFSSYPIRELERLRYPKQFVRQAEDNFTHRVQQSYGFKTTAKTRPLLIAGLVEIVRDYPDWICDRDTLEEMLTFVRNERGRAEAQEGAHDDCVMALGIAYYSREQQSTEAAGERRPWTKDMLEDYKNASAEEKAMLRRKWGRPKEKRF